MQRITTTGRVNLRHLFWLRNLAIIGQLATITVAQVGLRVHLPLPEMVMVIALECIFNALTWMRVLRAHPESDFELFSQLWVDISALSMLLFLSGGTTNPFVSLYLPSLAIAAAVLPWRLMAWLAALAVAGYVVLSFQSVPLDMDNPAELFDYYRLGTWVNFIISVGLIAWFVARMSNALRQRDAALADAQQSLLRDERAVALGVQAVTVAHEIGTPLSTMAMLIEELREAARVVHCLAPYEADLTVLEEQITLCTCALARLRSRVSGPARAEPLAVWLSTFAQHWRLRYPQVRLELRGMPPADIVLSDAIAIGQILTILLDNAARASPDHVTLAARGREDTIEFDVADTGPGVPVALRGALGAMPVNSTQGGHGVGLYLAFNAAARLKGGIELADAKPHGTRARLWLPVCRELAAGSVDRAVTAVKEKHA